MKKLQEGWNEEQDLLDVFVEDGQVLRGIKYTSTGNQTTVYPYKIASDGSLNQCTPIPVEDYQRLCQIRKIAWR